MSEETKTNTKRRGWLWPRNQRKAHFFDEASERPNISLCGRVGMLFTPHEQIFGHVENNAHKSVDNCAACNKRRNKLYPNDK